jgi:hypothetical protein
MSIFCATPWNYVPRQVDDDCLQELRWLYARRDLAEARSDPAAWLARWAGKYPRKVRNRKPSAAAHFSVRSVAAHTGFSKSTVAPYFAQPHHSKGFSSTDRPVLRPKGARHRRRCLSNRPFIRGVTPTQP